MTQPQASLVARPPLTARRTLAVVAVAIVTGATVGALALVVVALLTIGSTLAKGLAGVVFLIAVIVIAVAVGFAVMITAVGIGLRGRARARVFTLLFAVTLVGVPVVLNAAGGLIDDIGLRPFDDDLIAAVVGYVALLWAVPAVAVGAVRWWWLAVVLAACAVLSVLAVVF